MQNRPASGGARSELGNVSLPNHTSLPIGNTQLDLDTAGHSWTQQSTCNQFELICTIFSAIVANEAAT
jgi:hypothetical protein